MLWQKVKNIYHLFGAVLANLYFGFPSRKLFIIGVTGTNGKTTTVQLVGKILEEEGYKVGLASTIDFWIGGKKVSNKTKFTTLSAWEVQKFLSICLKNNCDCVVLETSSHSLDQKRVWGVLYDIAVLTNITREHLDYHKKMEYYRFAKKRLILSLKASILRKIFTKKINKGLKDKSGVAVINLDMEKPEDFIIKGIRSFGYSTKKKETIDGNPEKCFEIFNLIKKNLFFSPEKYFLEKDGVRFFLNQREYYFALPGIFNLENALAGFSVGRILGISENKIKKAIFRLKNVPGRLEKVVNSLGIEILIDYALTPDSMEKLGKEFLKRKKDGGKLIWIFGSCGDRDRGKRPIMGKIVDRFSDYTIITNEDPYTEDPWQIINEIFKGIKEDSKRKEGAKVFRILDRRKAIEKGLSLAKKGDIILITGKGAEENIKIGDQLIPWSDRRVIKESILKIKKRKFSGF